MNKTIKRGFTLIEVLVVVAIIGILASVAYPSYVDSVRKSNRASAKARMTDVAQREGVFYSEQTGGATYTTDLSKLNFPAGTLLSESKAHSVTVAAGTAGIATSYTITATAVGSETTACRTLTLDHLGTFGPAGC
jgi:type IV pilus assembly protein PilE